MNPVTNRKHLLQLHIPRNSIKDRLSTAVEMVTSKHGSNKLCVYYQSLLGSITAYYFTAKLNNSVALVCERTIRTERARLVGEVSANFCG
jgi:hypothetical protein